MTKTIQIGTEATGRYWSDCIPLEVIEMTASGKTITLRELDAEPAEGYDYFSNQVHTFSSNPENRIFKARFRKHGGWTSSCGLSISFGTARKYTDPQY
ncbi:gp668 [Bacillus phage G]|uniref:Gp668 n=1 Tax=Bacillus phage G TaxID=2884420 RepID=G3MB48_9CAUD|nr:gp668 [Bacillus phage G]AEO93911.1 gp668 [Bacillus phage G]